MRLRDFRHPWTRMGEPPAAVPVQPPSAYAILDGGELDSTSGVRFDYELPRHKYESFLEAPDIEPTSLNPR